MTALFELLSHGVNLAEMEVHQSLDQMQCDVYLQSIRLNKAISDTIYDIFKHNKTYNDEDYPQLGKLYH